RRRKLLARLGLLARQPVDLDAFIAPTAPSDVGAELRALYRLLDELPEGLGTILILHRVEGLELAEIAPLLDLSVRTVKRRLARARRVLERRLCAQGAA